MIEIVRELGSSRNAIVTIAIGDRYYKEWKEYAKPSWLLYCERYDLGLFVVKKGLIKKRAQIMEKANMAKIINR